MDAKHLAFLARQPSARVQLRERFWGMPKRGIALILANAMFWQPLWAQADGIVVSSGSTSVGAAGNGVPIVNIAAPNASGLSHNQFQQYNVGSQGVILNNAPAPTQTQNTQLGGIIISNSNLQGAAATTILNEVVSNNRSELKGYTEVAGQAARVIVANPYGITCDGCGFLNTPQATLTTGKPVLDSNGNLVRFNVQGGSVAIEGLGLNADNLDQFDIITRSAKVNAELHAKKLNIIAGRNDVDAQTLNATALADDGSTKPQLAIDSSALGGMYAGAVKLVGTEAGVGVRLAGNMAASAGDIQIDANGQLSMVQTAASGAVTVNANAVEVNGPLYAGSALSITTPGDLAIQQNIAARDSVTLSSTGLLSNSAIIEAGVNADNSRNAAGDVVLSAGNLTNTGNIVASRAVQATVTQTLNNQGATLSGQASTRITATTLDNRQSGRILSQGGNVSVTASNVSNGQKGLMSSAGTLTINADSLDNTAGSITSTGTSTLTVTDAVVNQGGEILSDAALTLTSGRLDNSRSGRIAGKGVTVTTGAFNNSQDGRLTSTEALRLTAAQVNNSEAGRIASAMALTAVVTGLDQHADGQLYSNGDVSLDLNNGHLNNQDGLITAPGQLLLTNLGTVNNQSGEISSAKGFTLAATSLDNTDGSVLSDESLVVRIDQVLTNLRGLVSATGLELSAATLTNRNGELTSKAALTATLGQFDNSSKGRMRASGALLLTATSLANTGGSLTSTGTANLTVTDAVVNQGGEILSDAALTLTSGRLDNSLSGRIAGKGVTVTTGAFNNSQDGRLTSTEALRLTAEQVNNSEAGRIASAMALTAVVTGLDQHADGRLYSNGDVSLDLGNGHLNNQDGLITAPGQLLLTKLGTVNNQRGEISSAKGFTLAATSLDNTDGTVLSDESLIVRIDKALTNLRGLVSGKGVDLSADTLTNDSGEVSSEAGLTLDVTGEVSNRQGLLSSAGAITLDAQSLDNTEGQVMADEVLTVTLAQALDNQAGTLGAGLGLNLQAASLDNRLAGAVLTDGQLDITLTGTLDNRTGGQVQAKGILNLTSQALNNQGGRVVGQDLLTVNSDSAINRGGVIRSDKLMTLLIGDLDNSQTGLSAAQKGGITSQAGLEFTGTQLNNQNGLLNAVGVMTLQADTVLNGQGRIASQNNLTATVDSLTQQGGELVAQGTLTLTGKTLDNGAGGLVGATKALKLEVDEIDNRAGEISSQVGVELIGEQLNNSDGGKVLAGTALQLIVERVINENKGLLFGQTLTLNGKRLDNAGGTLASQQAQTLTLSGALDNRAGLISSEAALTVKAASLDNMRGTLSSAGALKVTTDGELINQTGSITTDAALTVVSASLDNREKGKLSGLGATTVTTGAFDNSQGGQLTSSDTLELIAGEVINQSAGRIASALALTASVTSLDQQGGELFSNTTLSLDLNNGQLNNQNGLINSPGALLLKNLKAVDNQGGEISSVQAFTLAAKSLDNSGGKLLSSQGLTLDLVEFFRNLKGTVSATGLEIDSDSLDNNEGLISSRAGLKLTVDSTLGNVKGTVIADGDLEISAASGDNTQGQISGKQALTAVIGNLQQQGGQLFALGTLNLTGDTLNNSLKGFVGAGEALTLTVDDVDNQGGEISSQQGITLTGQTLTNTGGQILAQQLLTLDIAKTTNRAQGVLSGKTGLTLTGTSLDNTGGVLLSPHDLSIDLSDTLDNSQGLISSEGTLTLDVGSLTNTAGSVSSAGKLTLDSAGAILNQGGELVTDGELDLDSTALDNSLQGTVSAKGRVTIDTGDLNNSQKGRISSGERMDLTAAKLTNHDGSIASSQALVASVNSLEQQKGSLTSATSLSLDVNQGLLDNQGGLINAPGTLLLKNLGVVLNQGGEISSAQAFTLKALSLDNSGGTLLSNQLLTLRIALALNNVKGLIAAAGVDATAATLDNTGGTLTSRNGLELTVTGQLTNRDNGLINAAETLKITSGDLNNRTGQLLGTAALTLDSAALDTGANGLINSRGTLNITADSLSADTGGEVSGLGAMTLVLNAISLNAGRLIGNAGLSVDLNGADLNNRAGLITATGPLTLTRVRNINNQGGEISSAQSFTLTGQTLDNSGGQLISSNLLTLNADSLLNQNGLISGWQGLDVTATSLDNRNRGTLSSRNGAVDVDLSGALLNSSNGALVSQTALTVTADSLDNRGGILSSGAAQTLTVTGLLNNSQNGLIDSGADLAITANTLDNSAGTITSPGNATLDLIGALTNTGGTLASGGDWLLKRSSAVNNQGGQLISQRLMTLNTGTLDNSNTGTVAANGTLLITATGKVLNHTDGLIYSQNAGVELDAASLDNTRGAVQGQSTLKVEVGEGVDNLNGRLIAQNGDLTVEAASLDSRGGVLSSLKGLLTTQITGVLRNGYDLAANRQGGVIQGQRLSLTALGGFDNYGGRVSASTGEALLTTANVDNRNGGIYAKGLVRVIGNDFDNSGDNDGQIAGGQVDLRLTGALNNRLGIIESDSSLAIKATSLDNQTGQIRSLGTTDAADFQIGTQFDNRNGTVEVANSNLILNAASFLNTNGNLLHAGAGTFDISTANLTQAGGNLVTRGGLTVTADNWTNSSVIQAGRLTVNVGTFNQTASGQLLASSAFVGTGGTWTNEGVIASDGTLSLNLSGGYAGGGRTSSLGSLGLTASQLALTSTASLMGGARTELNISGLASNYGRLTSAADLIVNAGSVTNYGTLGATQNLTFNTASLLNSQGLIFSGGDMQANVGSLTNLKGDFYALNNLTIKGYGVERANQVSNISGSMESGGNFAISATAFENRTEGSDSTQVSTAGRTLVKGVMAINCLDCGRGFLVDHVVREYFEGGQDTDATASSLLASGQKFIFDGGSFLNSKSTISATGNVVINAGSFKNIGSIGGAVERTRIYRSSDWYTVEYAKGYNERNNPDYPNVYYVDGYGELRLGVVVGDILETGSDTTYQYISYRIIDAVTSAPVNSVPYMYYPDTTDINRGMPSLYDRNNLVDVPEVIKNLELISDVEKVIDGGNASRSAIIQSGGNVSITATQNLQNSVIRQDYVAGGGTSKVQGTSPSGTGTAIIRVNAQLPPDLSQQQVNPLALPGFSLPTGQNGLFRLNAQTGSNVAVTQTSTTPQNWTLGSASVSVAQREQTVSDTQARALQFGTAGQVSTATRQLADVVRQNSGLSANASAFDSSAPVDSATRLQLTGHSAGSTELTQVVDVTQVQGQNGTAPLPGQGATTVPVIIPVASNNTTAQNGTTTPTAVPNNQVARVQGLPGTAAPSNPHKYLIETNPLLTELRQFMSSDYLLANLGYDPEASARRLGDGLYEQRLVQQAVVARTGQALLAGQTSNEDQFKYLMNNAIASKEQLNLAVGVSLSSKQVAALTHDIVWLEEHEVNGEKVLVPVLYLAQANNRLGPTGALIAGNDVTLIAGDDLDNVGTLRATNNLSATAGNNLVNVGLIEAGNRLDLLAGNDLINKAGGILYGRDVTLTATRGDVINERTVIRDQQSAGVLQDFVENAARIESANDLVMKAGRDVMNIGGTLQAGRDLSLIAGRDVSIDAVQKEKVNNLSVNNTQSSITQLGSSVSVGRDLIAQSGRDISIIASNIDAKRDIAMAATENLTLSSAADEQHSSSKAKKSTSQQDRIDQVSASMNAGGNVDLGAGNSMAIIASHIRGGGNLDIDAAQNLTITSAADEQHSYSKTKKVTSQQDRVTQVSSTLSAGGNVALGSGKDMEIIASHIRGEGDVDIDAAQDLTITSAMDESASFYSKKSKGSFGRGSSKQQESYDSTNVASIIEAGGDLTVNTSKSVDDGIVLDGGHNVTVIGSQLRAGDDLLVGATNDVAVLSGVEEHGSYSKKTKSGFLGLSKSGKSQLTTTASQVASELEADNDVVIAAGNDVRLRASETSAGNDVELRAGLVNDSGDINLVSANDTAYSRSEEYKKKTGLSASGGFISISSAKEAGREAQSSTSVGSNVLADRDATLQATRDVNVLGSGISAGRNVSLNAGRDVNIAAAQNESAEQEWSKNKQVGIGVSGNDNGVSLFIGADSLQEKARLEQQTAAASQVSAGQDLVINAKRDINQIGSDLNASNDIDLTAGRNINIDAARETQLVEQQRETERSGLGVSINHNYGKTKDAVSGAGQGDDAVSQGSSTLKGIDAIGQFLAGPTADVKLGNSKQSTSQEIIEQTSRSSTLNAGNDVNMTAGNDVTVKGGQLQAGRDINIKGRDITLDVAKDSISQESSQSESWGGIHGGTSGGFKLGIGGSYGVASEDGTYGSSTATQAAAGRDINLDASNDINLVGTQVMAGRDIDLNAGNDLNIRSAQNESNSESDRHSGGGEVGLTFGSQGVGVYASVSMGKGNLDRDSARQQNASLNAGNQLGFSSGNDTNVAGATLRGDEVVGRVGGDLNVSSVTDTGKVEGKEFDINATVTIGPGAGISGSVGYGATNGSTNWVGQQTSITAKDKVDIRTENHTQLDGALIASDSGNLKLDTGTLGFSDIAGKDKEHGYYLNVGGTYNPSGSTAQDPSQEGKGEKSKNGWSVEGWNYEKDREQIVRATVGAGEVVVRNDAETGGDSTAGLNRDVSKAYEITKDEESRTDLYVSKSSLEAVSNPKATLQQWQKNISLYGENSKEAVGKLIDLLVLMALLPREAVSGRGVETAEIFVFARENERQLSSQDAGKRADRVRLLLNAVAQGELGPDSEAVVSRLSALAAEDPTKAMRAIGLLASLSERSSGVSHFVPIAALGAGAIAALGGALVVTASTPENQERMKEAANAVVNAVAQSGQTAQIQTSISIEIWKIFFNTTFPVHLLDAENSRLVNPIVEAQSPNPASGGYAAGSPVTTPISTGGSQVVDQAANDYSNPIAELPAPGVMNQDNGDKSVPNLTERGTLVNLRPGDVAIAQRPVRALVQDDTGRYWLQTSTGQRLTPSGSYDFVTMPDGTIRVARPNVNEDFSTHLGLSGGGEVKYAGSIRFGNNEGPNRGVITQWTNNSGHYQPPATLKGSAGLPQDLFKIR